MSTMEKLRKDKMLAMKNKDKLKSGVISLMMSNILLEQKEKKRDLTDDEQIAFVKKELKETVDALEQTPKDRVETIEETKQKIEIIKSYLPEQISEEKLKEIIEKFMEENSLEKSNKSIGQIMKYMMAEYGKYTDGKTVNKIVREIIGA